MSSKVKEFSSESGNKTLGKHQNRICNTKTVKCWSFGAFLANILGCIAEKSDI